MKTKTETLTVVGLQYALTASARKVIANKTPFIVELQREPDNEADFNSILVVISDPKVSKEKRPLGHLRRTVAAALAPRMDIEELKVISARITWMDATEADVKVKFSLSEAKNTNLTK